MFQVLVVDDEKKIRDEMSRWSWGELEVETIGCCAHGLEALRFLSLNPADIVLTDIRMPFMNGIELMEALNELYPFIHVVILSGYSDFEYARKAIQLCAADYLLKPIVFEDVIQSLKKITSKLEAQKQIEQRLSFLQRKNQKLSRTIRDKFLNDLFYTPFSPEYLEQYGAEGEVMIENGSHTAAVLLLDRLRGSFVPLTKKEADLFIFSLDNILTKCWDAPGQSYHLVNRNTLETCLLSKGLPDMERYEGLRMHLLKYKGLFMSTFSVVSGPAVPQPWHIHHSLKDAFAAVHHCRPNSIFLSPERVQIRSSLAASPGISNSEGCNDGVKGGMLIHRAKQYIKNNYQRSITLAEVAGHSFISASHLSGLFKQNGTTFLKYLTDIRMRHARNLLADPQFHIYEIVEKVGYSDSAYFSELFKKHSGMTPNEYRRQLELPLEELGE